jgi:hypothetical protein
MATLRTLSLLGLATAGASAAPPGDPWERAVALVAKMSLAEKMQLIQGNKAAVDPEVA